MALGLYAGYRNYSVVSSEAGPEMSFDNHSRPWNESLSEDYIFDRTDVRVIFITLYSIVFACCFFDKVLQKTQCRTSTVSDGGDLGAVVHLITGSISVVSVDTGNTAQQWPNLNARALTLSTGPALNNVKSASVINTADYWASIGISVLSQVAGTVLGFSRSTFRGLKTGGGNLLVILVVSFSRRLRSITNFFLANLAVADLCVGIFCVYQTLTNYLVNSWLLGDFLCKVYMFVHALSYTASIMILVVVCSERYLAIVHPIKCRAMLTRGRLRVVIGVVWLLAAIYASPRFIYVETIRNQLHSGGVDVICIANMKKHNKNVLDAVNVIFLYILPLIVMCCLYTRIGVGLWRSGAALGGPGLVTRARNGRVNHVHTSSRNVLRARRGVIRMLIAVVVMFAVCNLPQHARIVWLHWDPDYDRTSDFSTILTVSTFLISYANSCLNPLLYAFLSRNFRKGMRELVVCNPRGQGGRLGITGRKENGHNTNVPHSSVVRLSSAHDSPYTTHTTHTAITRQNTLGRTSSA